MARNGKSIDALVVFAHSIRYLKDQAIEIIRERTGDKQYCEKDIQWVITVPAIWEPAAKQFMREAACEVYIFLLNLFLLQHIYFYFFLAYIHITCRGGFPSAQ